MIIDLNMNAYFFFLNKIIYFCSDKDLILIYKLNKFLSFYKEADTIYNIHSPFVFEFMLDVFDTSKEYYVFRQLEAERNSLATDQKKLTINDLGAGSKTGTSYSRTISDISRNVVSNEKKCRMLFNHINKFQPFTMVELGTSLGIASLYMAMANKKGTLHTIEGASEVFDTADRMFKRLQVPNIKNYKGDFDQMLSGILESLGGVDFAFIDGNHSYGATMKYFEMFLPYIHTGSALVFDDIYWSEDMTKAWNEIKSRPEVCFTIDTFDLGFVYFDPLMSRKDFKVIDFWKKPFSIGLWG